MGALAAFVFALLAALPIFARADQPQFLHANMSSALLAQFWGRQVVMDAYVLLPDSYYKEPARRYPVIYWIQGFNGDGRVSAAQTERWLRAMRASHHQYIVVFPDAMFQGGDVEFVDSPNNGPWGAAFTGEFIPWIESVLRVESTRTDRFVAGHSSGGWAALWLQVRYPALFNGEWSVSPDPIDFRDFTGPDLTRTPPQNFFTDPAGHAYWLMDRPLRDFVTGPGWERRQFDSFDAVFGPRGSDGKPEPLFDRKSGIIDPAVQQYWDRHYDLAELLNAQWPQLRFELQGRLHIIVGTKDTFGLDRSVRLFQEDTAALNSGTEFDYVPGGDHWSVLRAGAGIERTVVDEAYTLQQQ